MTFAPEVNLASQLGRTIDLFDWTGVTPSGVFNVTSPYTWNLSNLYTTGEVTLTAVPGLMPGDFNNDGRVDADDYVVWRKTDCTPTGYNAWRTHFGQTAFSGSSLPSAEALLAAVAEPASLVLLMCGLLVVIASYRRAPTSSKLLQAKSAVIVVSIVVASTSHLAPAHAASITSLGFDGVSHGVTNDGSLVVGEYSSTSFYSGFQNNAVAWRAVGGVKTLGSGVASAVTADGSFVVGQLNNGTSFSGGQLPFSPIRWTKTTTVSLGLPTGVSSAGAFGMSADGSVVMIESGSCGAGGCHNGGSGAQYYRWTQASGIVPLGLGGGWGTGVSADGSVIAGYIPGPRAFRWTAATGAADLGTLNGATSSQADAVSPDGSVVVGESNGRAFRWTEATVMVDLGADGAAYALSADGSIVMGGTTTAVAGRTHFTGASLPARGYLAMCFTMTTGWT